MLKHRGFLLPLLMNWYQILKSAMPLPDALGYPANVDPFRLPVGIKRLDKAFSQEQADQITNDHPDLNYLGAGIDGIAYTNSDPEKVVKITHNRNEADMAKSLIGKHLPCCIQIYSVDWLPTQTLAYSAWKIVSEKVSQIPKDEYGMFREALACTDQNETDEYLKDRHQKLGPEFSRLVDECKQLLECLKANRMPVKEVMAVNLGRRANGQLVLLDVG
jgi:hypothetical protein